MQSDLAAGIEERAPGASFDRPKDATPLKLNEFKLPKDVPLQIPPGTTISPDLSKLTLPEDMDLQLPEDLDLSNLDFELPEDFKLELPKGTQFSPPDLKLPEGATIKLPDGREFKIPAGSDLSIPPELMERLLEQGLPAGALSSDRSFDIQDLPADLHATIDPPRFDGGGSLHLPGGTTITLPDGTRVPFPPGMLPYAARYLLPAGTTFDIPFDATSPGGTFPVPQPRSSTQLVDDGGASRVAVSTEITGMPSRVRKGETVLVSGYVRESATGRAVGGAPVDVFMNESKRAPGVLVGQGASDASGTFSIRLTLPADKPASNYQLVNHAAAFVDPSGRAFADGWGDPPFATFATTNITLDLPARDGLGVATTFGGTLLDHTGAPVPAASIVIVVDGAIVARPATGANGRYSVAYTFPAGSHRVEARFERTANYDASQTARGTIVIDDYAIEIASTLRGKPGEGVTLAGRVLGRGAVAPDRLVSIAIPFQSDPIRMTSDSAGRFSYSFATPPTTAAGLYSIRYSLPQHNVTKTQTLELNQTGRLSLALPSAWDVEIPVPTVVTLQTPQATPIAGQAVRVTITGAGGARDITRSTDASGTIVLDLAPLRATPGTYNVTARVVDTPNLDAAPATDRVALGLFEVRWSAPVSVIRGQEMSGSATVLFAGRPLAGTTVTLDIFGPRQLVTSASGIVSWSQAVPTRAPLGKLDLTLQALDHPVRSKTIEVVAVPKLTLATADTFTFGKPIPTRVTLVDDQGEPMRDSKIVVSAGGTPRHVTTDSRGRWEGELNSTGLGENVTMSARFDESRPYLAAQTQSAIVATDTPIAPGRLMLWILPIVGAAIAGGVGAWYYVRKRPARAAVVASAPVVAPVAPPTDLDLRFVIPEGEPTVWGRGEPLVLSARNHGEAAAFELSWPGGTRRVELAEDANASTVLTFPDEGDVTLTARRVEGDFAPTSTSVRIVDYRKETAREFDLFLEKARQIESTLTRQSTPREIAWLLEARLGADARAGLDEMALVMEITNYSHYDVAREHYLRFVRAARTLDPFLAPPAPAPPGG